ncbi:MAG TPA: prolipoprotein diacylglyceryl transferase family protein [Polyangiaceae bacterium]|jgi:phosphatidylglycerol:prolipoprotein diacylglycerol transferase
MRIHDGANAWIYPTLVTASLLLLFLVPSSRAIVGRRDRLTYWALQVVTLLGAIVGAKLAMLAGDLGWPVVPLGGWHTLLWSGRSITGGLIGGFLAAEATKPLVGWTLPPNNHFAAKLPFSIALGRLGCLLGGCCRGLPHEGALSVVYDDGIPRWPAPVFEMVFQLAVGLLFVRLVRRDALVGRLFALYLMLYGAFRFATEPLRETPKSLGGALSVYQALSIVMIALGALSFFARGSRARGAQEVTS